MIAGMRLFQFKFIFSCAIVSLVAYSAPELAQANESKNTNSSDTFIRFIQTHVKPPSRGTPPSREGTGSRGDCFYQQNSPGFTRLVGSEPLKFTVKEHPTIWIYVPYSASEAPIGEFSLQDDEDEIYRTQFQLPAAPGVVGIALPATLPPLAVGREYRWYVDITCPRSTSTSSTTPASITGAVERIAPTKELEQALKAASSPLERVKAYASHGVWYETLTELAQLRLQNPRNASLEQAWIQLLSDQSIGLAKIAKEPIRGTVTASSQSR